MGAFRRPSLAELNYFCWSGLGESLLLDCISRKKSPTLLFPYFRLLLYSIRTLYTSNYTPKNTFKMASPNVTSKTFTLNTGDKIPALGLGTWQSQPHEVEKAVEIALRRGYRHIDTALAYGNEAEVGLGIKNSGVPREQIWLTTKLDNPWHKRVQERIETNFELDGWDLTAEEVKKLDGLPDRFKVCGDAWLPIKVFFGDDE